MPKSYSNMKKEVYAKMKAFEKAGDIKGLARYMVTTAQKYHEEFDADPTQNIEESNLSHFSNAIAAYVEKMAADPTRDANVISLFNHLVEEVVDSRIELGKKMDEVKHDMKLGMIKNTELIADEPKTITNMSSRFALINDKNLGRKIEASNDMLRQINMSYTKVLEKPKFQNLVSTLNVARGEEIPFKKAWDTHEELDEETKKRYQKETNIVITSFKEKVSNFVLHTHEDPDKAIKKVPDSIRMINECKSFDELEALRNKALNDKQKHVEFDNRRLEESKKAREFLEQLKAKNIDPPSQEYNELCEVLEEFGKLGHGMRSLIEKDHRQVYDNNQPVTDDISQREIENAYDCIVERCRNFVEKHPEHGVLSSTIKDFATQSKNTLKTEYEELAKIHEPFKSDWNPFRTKHYDVLLGRINVAEERMFMNTEKPTQRYNSIKNFYNATDDVYFGLLPLLDKITKDYDQRDAADDDMSPSYIEFAKTAKRVQDNYNFIKTNGRDVDQQMSKILADNLESLMKAANTYTDEHTGFTNMFKATHGVGAERLEWSKAFGEKIGKSLPGYRETVKKLPKLEGGTYGSELTQIEFNMMDDRDAARRKIKLAKELDPKINAAHDKVNSTYTPQLKTEQECPEGMTKEEFFEQQKALVTDYAAKVLAVNLSGKQLKELQPNYKNMRGYEINQLNKETLSEQGIANTAESILKRDDWKLMTNNMTTWDDINRIKNLAAQNKGAGLVAELNRCDKVLNQNAANAVNNAEQAKIQAKQELESKGFVVM